MYEDISNIEDQRCAGPSAAFSFSGKDDEEEEEEEEEEEKRKVASLAIIGVHSKISHKEFSKHRVVVSTATGFPTTSIEI